MSRHVVHLVCNAHLDPVWLWPWEDGLAEAIATFRVAADFCERESGFVFNHNEALLYHWIEQYEPCLHDRIRRLVADGRWHIAGGAWLQPDVNGTSGESHIRQFLYGLRYFQSRFAARPRIAYNFDPFGHAEGFPQILAACGMQGYIFCRPDHGTYELPVGAFHWHDRSGSSILARRSDDHYHSNGKIVEQLEQWLPHYADEAETMILWGIGNHGGGPSRQEYADLQAYIAAHPEREFRHSTPENFFASIGEEERQRLPTVSGEIQNSFAGCYTSMSRVKRGHRRAEAAMQVAERLAAMAWWFGYQDYPRATLDTAWKDILFAEFHDILPGTSQPDAEQDSIDLLGRCQEELRRCRSRSIWGLLAGEAKAAEGEVPIFIFNPYADRVCTALEVELTIHHIPKPAYSTRLRLRHGGQELAFQRLRPRHNTGGDWRQRVLIPVDLAPMEILRLDASFTSVPPRPPRLPRANASRLRFESKRGVLRIDPRSGLIDLLCLPSSRRSLLAPGAFQPVTYADLDHSWTCGDAAQVGADERVWSQAPGWQEASERFRLATATEAAALSPIPADRGAAAPTLAPLRIIEAGPLLTVVEAIFIGRRSQLVRQYWIGVDGMVEIRDRLLCGDKDTMLKLLVPFATAIEAIDSETTYSVVRRQPTAAHDDCSNQRFLRVRSEAGEVAVINDGSFAHSCRGRELAVNLIRTPAYSSFRMRGHIPYANAGFAPRQDQGEHQFRFRLLWGEALDEADLARQSDIINAPPVAQVVFPSGDGERSARPESAAWLSLGSRKLRVVAVKKAEAGEALVIRIQNHSSRRVRSTMRLRPRRQPIDLDIPAYGLQTWRIEHGGSQAARQINAVEEPFQPAV